MTVSWRHLPVAARPIAAATDAAVTAARAGDLGETARAVGDLAALDPAQVGLILGTTVRLLLEDRHPDGLTSDDVRAVVTGCVRNRPGVDPQTVVFLLAGALDVLDEEQPPPAPQALARDAVQLIVELLGDRPVAGELTRALGEIERTQLND